MLVVLRVFFHPNKHDVPELVRERKEEIRGRIYVDLDRARVRIVVLVVRAAAREDVRVFVFRLALGEAILVAASSRGPVLEVGAAARVVAGGAAPHEAYVAAAARVGADAGLSEISRSTVQQ